MYTTEVQKIVVESRLDNGYTLIGKVGGSLGVVFVLTKGKHIIAINHLGYDEHTNGKNYKLFD